VRGHYPKARELNIPVRIVFLTYGDNNEWSFMVYRKRPVILPKSAEGMGMVRAHEAIAAEKNWEYRRIILRSLAIRISRPLIYGIRAGAMPGR
jgi:hypothetical protein